MASSIQIPVTQTGLEASIEAAAKRAGRNLQINLGTNAKSISSLSQPLGKITGQANEFTKSMEAANARVFAFGASVGVVNMVAKAFGALVKNTIAVESSLAEINVVLGKNSQELDKFGNKLFDLAKATGQTFDTVAQGALELSRQGLNATDTIKRLNDALILSRLSGLDAAQSVEGLTAAINSFKEAGISSEQIVNKLVNVSQKYAVSEKDLIEGIKRSASVANQAGVSFDELVGIITTVQERTARGGAVIGNAFKTIFAKIQDKGALQDLQSLGVQVTDTAGKILPATSILENLAKQFDSLSQTQQTDIAKKLGGVYQLSNLLAALKDLGKEQSNYNDIVQLSATSTNQAYQKNIALNETLASIINRVSLSAEQLGATLGKIGMTDSAKNLLNFFNSLLEGIQNVLGEQSAMGDFVRGLVKGIGNLVSGPGLALFGAIIAKLSKDLVEFGFSSLKSFFKIGDAAKEISNVQNVIAETLLTNKNIQSQILAIENSALSIEEKRATQTKFFTDALNAQLGIMNQMKGLAISIAPGVYSGTGGKGVKGAAGGYMPALAKESSDIKKGVGGARSGDRPVVIPNFAFGGGQKGSMVAHTGEYIVPNFANGGSAIFNRNMVRSMGLPAGAKKIGAAGGFVPNFAAIDKFQQTFGLARSTVQKEWNAFRAYYPNAPINAFSAEPNVINAYKTWRTSESRSISKVQSKESSSLSKLSNADKEARIGFIYSGNQPVNENRLIDVKGQSVPVKFLSVVAEPADFLYKEVRKNAIQTAKTYAENIGVHPDMVNENQFESILNQSFNEGALQSVVGTIFEAALQGSIGSPPDKINQSFDIPNQSQMKSLANSFGKLDPNHKNAGLSSALNKLVVGDFKNSLNSNNVSSLAAKIARENINQGKISTGSKGYIPNFADPLGQAVGREIAAGVPSSQIYIDKNPSLKSAANPMGLMVANRRDEPNGGRQGINRAIKEGRNPKTYGAANGFIPNFAPKLGDFSSDVQGINVIEVSAFNNALHEITKELRTGKKSFVSAILEMDQYSQMLNISEADQKKLSAEAGKLLNAYNSELIERNKKAQELRSQRNQPTQQGPQAVIAGSNPQSKDMLGSIFAVQGFLSVLSGFTQDLQGISGKMIKGLNDIASISTTAAFASNGLKEMGGKIGKFAGALGPWGIAAAALFESFKVGADLYNEHLGITKIVNESLSKMSDAANKASVNLSSMSKSNQVIVREKAKDLFTKATSTEGSNFADLFEGFGDELPNALLDAITQASAAGVYDEYISNLISQARTNDIFKTVGPLRTAEFTTKEVKDLISKLAELTEETKGTKEALFNFDFSKKPELLKNLLVSDEEFNANLNATTIGDVDKYSELRDLLSKGSGPDKMGVVNPVPQNELLIALRTKLLAENETKDKERKNQLEQINLDLAKEALKNALELSKIMDRQFNSLDKRILSARIIGDLSKEELRNLEYVEQQREVERKTADETSSIISQQIDKLKGITGLMPKAVEMQKELASLSTSDLNNKYKVLEILQEITQVSFDNGELSQAELDLLSTKVEQLMKSRDLSKEELEAKQKATEEAYKQTTLLKTGLKVGLKDMQDNVNSFGFTLGKEIPQLFADNMAEAMGKLIDSGESFGDVLQNAAYNFVKEINSKIFSNVAQSVTSSIGNFGLNFASGGQITGGSGTKDDVPAMLMGGEFVINKRAAQKYGPSFLNALNNGSINAYAKGGKVQKGPQGNYFTPGQYGLGAISGSQNLLSFASQAYTGGSRDKIVNQGRFASIGLEAESGRLTNFGRRNGPAAEVLRSTKEEAFGLYLQDYQAKQELQKQKKTQDKAFRNQLIMLAASVAVSSVASAGATGFKNAYNASANTGAARYADALKGIYSGGDIGEGIIGGGLKNTFSGNIGLATQKSIPKASIVNEASQAPRAMSTISQIQNSNTIGQFKATAYGLGSIDPTTAEDQRKADAGIKGYQGFSQTIGASGRKLQAGYSVASNHFPLGSILNINGKEFRVDDTGGMSNNVIDFFAGGDRSLYNSFANMGNLNVSRVRATGGSIPSTSGIDTIPTMLSGGEFIMNRAAAQNIGAGNLQALNSGAKSLPTEEKSEELNDRLLAKLDELIDASGSAGNITINVDGAGKGSQTSEGKASEGKQQLARQIRDAVLKVIQEEKRLGGQLRRGM